jgi:hypothetical protein
VKGTLVLRTVLPFAGGYGREGLRLVPQSTRVSNPRAGRTGDKGCSGVAEEGNLRNHPRSAGPSLGLSTHRTRATGSQRRKALREVDDRSCIGVAKPSRGKAALGWLLQRSWPAACRPSLQRKARRGHHRAQTVKKVAAFVTLQGPSLADRARTSCFELQKSTSEGCRPHRSASHRSSGRVDRKVGGVVNGGLVQGVETSVPQEIGAEVELRVKPGFAGAVARW